MSTHIESCSLTLSEAFCIEREIGVCVCERDVVWGHSLLNALLYDELEL